MLEEILRHINNRFERDSISSTITITVDGLQGFPEVPSGAYFWLEGSLMNDGLHKRATSEPTHPETFDGQVVLLAIPKPLVDLSAEIETWCENNADALNTPYESEAFGGYSYKREGGASEDAPSLNAWQAHFASRLRPYRKLSRSWR